MKTARRTIPLAALAILATTLAFSVPAFAWHVVSFSTSMQGGSFAIGTTMADTANLELSATSVSSNYNYGTITFYAYQGTCTPSSGKGTGTLVYTSSPVTVTGASNGASASYTDPAGFDTTGMSAGSYYFVAVYSGSVSSPTYPGATAACEPFSLYQGGTVPEFPLGMALLIGLAIPALLLFRTRFAKFGAPKLP